MFREAPYDIVLMDVEMPVMDGYEATRDIRRYEQSRASDSTPILALTAHAFTEMAAKGFEAGFTDLLTKPIRKATLLEALLKFGGDHQAAAAEPALPAVNVVEVEQGLEDVVPSYLAKRRAELLLYKSALETSDFDGIKKMAHKMKGTGTGYGFPKLTEFGAVLEKAALDRAASQIGACLADFELYLGSIQLKYSKDI
jgi:CheY-like chemotaxis protein